MFGCQISRPAKERACGNVFLPGGRSKQWLSCWYACLYFLIIAAHSRLFLLLFPNHFHSRLIAQEKQFFFLFSSDWWIFLSLHIVSFLSCFLFIFIHFYYFISFHFYTFFHDFKTIPDLLTFCYSKTQIISKDFETVVDIFRVTIIYRPITYTVRYRKKKRSCVLQWMWPYQFNA